MMLSTSRTVPRLPPLRDRTTTGKVFRPIQIRAFRFGMWASCFDSAYHRELRHRHRALKHKYLDSIGKRLPWHDHPFAEEFRFAPKRAAARFWPPTVARSSSRWVNQDETDSRKTSSRSMYPPFHFDAKLRGAKLWGSYLDHIIEPLFYQTPLDATSQSSHKATTGHARASTKPKKSEPRETMQSNTNTTTVQDYMIDPITNRKVPKKGQGPAEPGFELPTRTFKAYKSRFAPFIPPNLDSERPPVYSNGQPPAAELNKYAESKFDDWPAAATTSSAAESTESSARPEAASHMFDSSTLRNEEYSLNHLPLEDPIEDHDGLATAPDEPLSKSSDTQNVFNSDHTPQPDSKSEQLQSELKKYGPYTYNEDSPSLTNPEEPKDLDQYRYPVSEVPKPSTEPFSAYDDLHKYRPEVFDKAKDQDQPFEQYGDLERYKDFRTQHLDTTLAPERDTVTESLKEYEAKEQGGRAPDVCGGPKKIPKMTLPEEHIFSKHYSSWAEADNTNSANKDQSTVQDAEKRLKHVSGVSEKEVTQLAPEQLRNISRLEPTWNRRVSAMKRNRLDRVSGGDFYSKEPQGLETSFSEECGGRQTMPLYTKTYGGEPGQVTPRTEASTASESNQLAENSSDTYYHRDPEIDGVPPSELTDSSRNPKSVQPDEPTVYKILAYDPSTQCIHIAETNSVVPDLTSPLSPNEVLPRLSKPTMFFPHFAPLQAEGFEIVSGRGDILVFRQMRPAKAAVQGSTTYVNPIDMMGRPAAVPNAAAFVSPTGFVNYDMPGVGEELPDRTGRSGVSVDRGGPHPVLGEKQSSPEDKKGKRKRMSLGKKMIVGGAWGAGITYALGVVSEYFYTGGTDGKGPEGFSPI